jgi:hypothetical protein
MLSRHAAPFDFYFNVAIVLRYPDLVCSELNLATIAHTLAMEVTGVADKLRTRFATESFDDARDLSHLYSKTSTTVS